MKTKTMAAAACCVALLAAFRTSAQEPLPKVREFGLGFTGFNSFSMQYRWGTDRKLYRITGNIGNSSSFGNSGADYKDIDKYDNITYQTTTSSVKTSTPVNVGAGLGFAILKLKPVTEHFGFLFGTTYGVSYSEFKTNSSSSGVTTILVDSQSQQYVTEPTSMDGTNDSQSLRVNVGLALGAYYKITPAFWLYAEIDPNIYYSFTSGQNSTSYMQQDSRFPMPRKITETFSSQHLHEFGISNLSNSLASLTLVYHFKK